MQGALGLVQQLLFGGRLKKEGRVSGSRGFVRGMEADRLG
jgi:hypothetical protein